MAGTSTSRTQVFQVPTPFQIPATGTLEYTYVIVPTGFKEDRWINAGGSSAGKSRRGASCQCVHSRTWFELASRISHGQVVHTRGAWRTRRTGGSSSAGASVREQVIAGFAPGRPAKQVPDGYAMLIPGRLGSGLPTALHHQRQTRRPMSLASASCLRSRRRSKRVIRVQASNAGLVIPPGAADYPVAGSAALGVDCELLNVYPHMHLRGKSMVLSAVYPTGEREEFVRVPHYDFNWQLVYSLSQTRILPKGTILKADATFDNSATNRIQSKSQGNGSLGRSKLGRDDGRDSSISQSPSRPTRRAFYRPSSWRLSPRVLRFPFGAVQEIGIVEILNIAQALGRLPALCDACEPGGSIRSAPRRVRSRSERSDRRSQASASHNGRRSAGRALLSASSLIFAVARANHLGGSAAHHNGAD